MLDMIDYVRYLSVKYAITAYIRFMSDMQKLIDYFSLLKSNKIRGRPICICIVYVQATKYRSVNIGE